MNYLSVGLNLVGGGLITKALRKIPGKEFSHWIPDRFIRPLSRSGKNLYEHFKPRVNKYLGGFVNSRFNGNFVSPKFHSLTDPFRFTKGITKNDKWPRLAQQSFRIPGWIPGAALVGATFTIDNCRCR